MLPKQRCIKCVDSHNVFVENLLITQRHILMWDGLLDYGRLKWQHTLQKIKRKLTNEANLLEVFDNVWGP